MKGAAASKPQPMTSEEDDDDDILEIEDPQGGDTNQSGPQAGPSTLMVHPLDVDVVVEVNPDPLLSTNPGWPLQMNLWCHQPSPPSPTSPESPTLQPPIWRSQQESQGSSRVHYTVRSMSWSGSHTSKHTSRSKQKQSPSSTKSAR